MTRRVVNGSRTLLLALALTTVGFLGTEGMAARAEAQQNQTPVQRAAGASTGELEVVHLQGHARLRPGYLRKNGVPYSANASLTEYFNVLTEPNGDTWLLVPNMVTDPQYLNQPFATSSHFKKLPNGSAWKPVPCAAR